jgi:DNA-binding MarR family transcriptional regulator
MAQKVLKKETSLLFMIAHQLNLYQNKILEPYGITGKQATILSFLLLNPDRRLTQRDFESEFNLCGSTINSVLNYLEKGGFLLRTVSETDGRAKNVKATAKGRQMLAVISELFQRQSDMVIKGFTPEEQRQFQAYLGRVLNNINEKRAGGDKVLA